MKTKRMNMRTMTQRSRCIQIEARLSVTFWGTKFTVAVTPRSCLLMKRLLALGKKKNRANIRPVAAHPRGTTCARQTTKGKTYNRR